MKKEKIETLTDQFIDENGNIHHFVIAAISEMLPTISSNTDYEEATITNATITHKVVACNWHDENIIDTVVKGLKIGFAICSPVDTFNEELGKTIAIGRARKNSTYALYVTNPGFINTKLVKAFLEQEAEYFKRSPESYIAGYKRK
jgi:hypothetical protein